VNNPQEVSRVQVLKREVQIYQAAIVVAEAVLPFKCVRSGRGSKVS